MSTVILRIPRETVQAHNYFNNKIKSHQKDFRIKIDDRIRILFEKNKIKSSVPKVLEYALPKILKDRKSKCVSWSAIFWQTPRIVVRLNLKNIDTGTGIDFGYDELAFPDALSYF